VVRGEVDLPKFKNPLPKGAKEYVAEVAKEGKLKQGGKLMIKLATPYRGKDPHKLLLRAMRQKRLLPGYVESLVDTLDDLFGFGVVPPTVLRHIDGWVVSVQEWIPNAIDYHRAKQLGVSVNHDDLIKIAILDIILEQGDRHTENVVVDDDIRAYAIDNELIFVGPHFNHIVQDVEGDRIPEHILEKMRAVDKSDFMTAFAGAWIPQMELERAWGRKKKLEEMGRIPTYDYGGDDPNELLGLY
jgi:hypothetical protein